jgi:hypothetical protein
MTRAVTPQWGVPTALPCPRPAFYHNPPKQPNPPPFLHPLTEQTDSLPRRRSSCRGTRHAGWRAVPPWPIHPRSCRPSTSHAHPGASSGTGGGCSCRCHGDGRLPPLPRRRSSCRGTRHAGWRASPPWPIHPRSCRPRASPARPSASSGTGGGCSCRCHGDGRLPPLPRRRSSCRGIRDAGWRASPPWPIHPRSCRPSASHARPSASSGTGDGCSCRCHGDGRLPPLPRRRSSCRGTRDAGWRDPQCRSSCSRGGFRGSQQVYLGRQTCPQSCSSARA